MNFPREARLRRIAELLPRFPEAEELLLRYRSAVEQAAPEPERDPHGPRGGGPSSIPARCPACGGPPGLSVLTEEPGTHGGARSLICIRCEGSWPFPRIVCPACGEEEAGSLPRFQTEEIPAARIEACDACGTYLKAIDLTRDARAVPAVDDLATCVLDLAARERGYRRLGEP